MFVPLKKNVIVPSYLLVITKITEIIYFFKRGQNKKAEIVFKLGSAI